MYYFKENNKEVKLSSKQARLVKAILKAQENESKKLSKLKKKFHKNKDLVLQLEEETSELISQKQELVKENHELKEALAFINKQASDLENKFDKALVKYRS